MVIGQRIEGKREGRSEQATDGELLQAPEHLFEVEITPPSRSVFASSSY